MNYLGECEITLTIITSGSDLYDCPLPKAVKHKVGGTLFNTYNKVNIVSILKIIYKSCSI